MSAWGRKRSSTLVKIAGLSKIHFDTPERPLALFLIRLPIAHREPPPIASPDVFSRAPAPVVGVLIRVMWRSLSTTLPKVGA
jgi:hypothetical protein